MFILLITTLVIVSMNVAADELINVVTGSMGMSRIVVECTELHRDQMRACSTKIFAMVELISL